MPSRLRKIIIRALTLPFVLALVITAMTTSEILYLRRLNGLTEHTQNVIGTVARTYRLTVDHETALRGYLLTGGPLHLQPFTTAAGELDDATARLERLVADNPVQLARVRELIAAIADWKRMAADKMVGWRDGQPMPLPGGGTPAVQDEGKRLMDGIRRRVDIIAAEERRLLAERDATLVRHTRQLLLGGGLTVVLLGGVITVILGGQIRAIEAIYRQALREREASEERERSARREAEGANQAKDQFLATVSHELRTPLTAILGWSRLLRSDRSDADRQRRAIEAIERNSVAQAQLIDDLLDVSRIVSGKLRLDLQETDLHKVIEAAIDSVRPAMEARQIRFHTIVDPGVAPMLGDPNRLQQVVWNLLSNAIKFTPKDGKVQLAVQRINSHVELTVRDSGQGIEPAFLPRLFQRFQQADSSESRAHGGLGLGLAITRHLVELHGGTIEAASNGPGEGSSFTVKLPVLSVAAATAASAAEPPRVHPTAGRDVTFECPPELENLKVLVVDDEADARELVAEVATRCGCVVATAGSTGEALKSVGSFRPDVILSDIGMPGEDGYALVRALRRLAPSAGGRTPAAALTAYARAEDRRQAMRAGFEMHLPKPVEPAELAAAIATLARIGAAMK
jgi:signal transduction histidine kinase/CheY-like chemotaxis protein